MPDSILVPKIVSSPEFLEGLSRLGVKALNPPSGFASGVRIIRDIERTKSILTLEQGSIPKWNRLKI